MMLSMFSSVWRILHLFISNMNFTHYSRPVYDLQIPGVEELSNHEDLYIFRLKTLVSKK